MGQAMGADFSGVKVHTDAQSDQLNQSIQAKAFTTGQDVFFRQGEYNPGSRGGQELIAHELTHVVQQKGGERIQRGNVQSSGKNSAREHEKKEQPRQDERGEEGETDQQAMERERTEVLIKAKEKVEGAVLSGTKYYHHLWTPQQKRNDVNFFSKCKELCNDEKEFVDAMMSKVGGKAVGHKDGHFNTWKEFAKSVEEEYQKKAKPSEHRIEKAVEGRDEANNRSYKDSVQRYHTREYRGREAVICKVIQKWRDTVLADYSFDLVSETSKKSKDVVIPERWEQDLEGVGGEEGRPQWVIQIVKNYDLALKETDGERGQGTQLGNTKAEYGLWSSEKK
jgi:hypothetical protein